MSGHDPEGGSAAKGSVLGMVSLVCSVIVMAGVTIVGLTSFLAGFNPPDWVRIATMAPIPFATIAAAIFGVLGLKGKGRPLAIAGLAITSMSVAAFAVMIFSSGY